MPMILVGGLKLDLQDSCIVLGFIVIYVLSIGWLPQSVKIPKEVYAIHWWTIGG